MRTAGEPRSSSFVRGAEACAEAHGTKPARRWSKQVRATSQQRESGRDARVRTIMMNAAPAVDRAASNLELEALDPLPCGCVAAVFRVGPYALRVISLEAKGPYCLTSRHAAGRVVELAEDDQD